MKTFLNEQTQNVDMRKQETINIRDYRYECLSDGFMLTLPKCTICLIAVSGLLWERTETLLDPKGTPFFIMVS